MAVRMQWRSIAITGVLSLVCGTLAALGGARVLQYLTAAVALGAVSVAAQRWPVPAALIALSVLPFLALTRRVINPSTSAGDPLLVLPAAFALICLTSPRARQPAQTPMSRIVFLLVLTIVVQILNPLQGDSILIGIVGAVLMATPMLWFFVGRAICTPTTMKIFTNIVILIAVIVSIYGLKQTIFGLAGFEDAWVESRGNAYTALSVGGQIRAFSTFSSSAEYGLYAGMGAVTAAVVWQGMLRWSMTLFLAGCTFMTGSRGIFLATAGGILVVAAAGRARSLSRGVAWLLPLLLAINLIANLVPVPQGESTASVLARRSLTGLASPFDRDTSTAGIHADNVGTGLLRGLKNPAGHGPGSVNQAGLALGGAKLSGESDLSDILVALGYPGELLLFALYLAIVQTARSGARRNRLLMVPAGLAMVTFNTWFVGGLYAVTATLWFVIGGLDRAEKIAEDEATQVTPADAK